MPRLGRRHLESPPLPDWLQWYMERHIGCPPLWTFPDLPPSANLAYERLDFDNRHAILDMFEGDPSPFVDAAFKDATKLYEYVAHNRICGPYSPKHGGADWIVCLPGGEPVGILHAYDISRETFALNHRRCSIGYAVAMPHRRRGVAIEAVQALQAYLFTTFDMLMLLAFPKRGNAASIRLLERLGYTDNSAAYRDETCRFFELYRSDEARDEIEAWRAGRDGERHGGQGRKSEAGA